MASQQNVGLSLNETQQTSETKNYQLESTLGFGDLNLGTLIGQRTSATHEFQVKPGEIKTITVTLQEEGLFQLGSNTSVTIERKVNGAWQQVPDGEMSNWGLVDGLVGSLKVGGDADIHLTKTLYEAGEYRVIMKSSPDIVLNSSTHATVTETTTLMEGTSVTKAGEYAGKLFDNPDISLTGVNGKDVPAGQVSSIEGKFGTLEVS
ncbi:hypothetical protein ACQV88_26345, partial [Ralstonia pseudosolanacearum]|uniref:hypothetical protein n=1 Tax=Ralstonia pseudosolanacearum TaxID=1310165 RepID=UPI003D2DE4FD